MVDGGGRGFVFKRSARRLLSAALCRCGAVELWAKAFEKFVYWNTEETPKQIFLCGGVFLYAESCGVFWREVLRE